MTIKRAINSLQRAGQFAFEAQELFQAAFEAGKSGVSELRTADLIDGNGQQAFDDLRALAMVAKALAAVETELRAVFDLAHRLERLEQPQPKKLGRPRRTTSEAVAVKVPKKRGRKPKAQTAAETLVATATVAKPAKKKTAAVPVSVKPAQEKAAKKSVRRKAKVTTKANSPVAPDSAPTTPVANESAPAAA